jgi:hypothetical protein
MKQCRMRVRIGRRRAERAQAARMRPHVHKLYSREEQHSNHLCCVTHRAAPVTPTRCVRACVRANHRIGLGLGKQRRRVGLGAAAQIRTAHPLRTNVLGDVHTSYSVQLRLRIAREPRLTYESVTARLVTDSNDVSLGRR